jgi:hypothetical protein
LAATESAGVTASGALTKSVVPRQDWEWLRVTTHRWANGDDQLAKRMMERILDRAADGLTATPTRLEIAHALDWGLWWFVSHFCRPHMLEDTVSTIRLRRDLHEWRKAAVSLRRLQRLQERLPCIQVNIATNQQVNNTV